MIELIMSVCSIANPSHCKDVSLAFNEVSLIQCQMGIVGQLEMSKWKEAHPNVRIAKWRCGEAGQFAKL